MAVHKRPDVPRKNRRQIQAEATRTEIVAAARRLFGAKGYSATSLAEVAEEANVAVQTIYASLGSKRALAMAMVDQVDIEGGVLEIRNHLKVEEDPASILLLVAKVGRNLEERCGDLLAALHSAAPVEPEVAEALAEGMRRRETGTTNAAHRLNQLDALHPSVTQEQAAATMALLLANPAYRYLVRGRGWSFDQAEEWLVKSAQRLLLRSPRSAE